MSNQESRPPKEDLDFSDDDLTERMLSEMDADPEPTAPPPPPPPPPPREEKTRSMGEVRENRVTSLRMVEPDWETIDIAVGMASLDRMMDVYQKASQILDRRRSEASLGRCSVCGNPWPEGRWRSEKVFPTTKDPMRFDVFRLCTDRCAIIFDQHVTAFRNDDQGELARIQKDYFPSLVKRLPNRKKVGA